MLDVMRPSLFWTNVHPGSSRVWVAVCKNSVLGVKLSKFITSLIHLEINNFKKIIKLPHNYFCRIYVKCVKC